MEEPKVTDWFLQMTCTEVKSKWFKPLVGYMIKEK
jgi:hypothetical protein